MNDRTDAREMIACVLIDFGHEESEWQFHNDEQRFPRPSPIEAADRILAALAASEPERDERIYTPPASPLSDAELDAMEEAFD